MENPVRIWDEWVLANLWVAMILRTLDENPDICVQWVAAMTISRSESLKLQNRIPRLLFEKFCLLTSCFLLLSLESLLGVTRKDTWLVLTSPADKPFIFQTRPCRAKGHINIVCVLSLLFFSYNYLRSALTQETAVEGWVGWKWHSLETFLFTPSAPCWCDPNWQDWVVNSASLTAISTTDQWFGFFLFLVRRRKGRKEFY